MFDFLVISNDILPFISVTQKILSLMSIILPIVLIIVIAIDLIKAVMAADDEQLAKSVKIAKKRVLLCIAFYMLPSLINIAIVQVYKSGAITSEQYSEIKDIFDKTINVSKIDVNDSSKNKEIEQSLSKNFAISVDEDLLQTTRNNEKNVIELSKKVLTSVLTSKNIVNKYIDRIDFCGTDCILHYDGNAYSINTDAYVNKVIVGYSDINSIRVIKDSTK